MKEEIPKNILLKSQYPVYKTIKPHYSNEIASSLINYISSTSEDHKKSIEIEIKLGKFFFNKESILNKINDTFIIPESNKENKVEFEANVESHFNILWFYINNETKFDKEIKLIEPLLYKEFILIGGKRISYCYDFNNDCIKKEIIKKDKKKHINVKVDPVMDIRVTSAVEIPYKTEDIEDTNQSPKNYREKLRMSYKFNFFRLDFTIVKSVYESSKLMNVQPFNESYVKSMYAQDYSGYKTTYEIEIEFEGLNYFLQNIRDEKMFESIVNRMLENSLMMIKSITNKELVNSIPNKQAIIQKFNHNKKQNNENLSENLINTSKLKPLYGNYFEYNQ